MHPAIPQLLELQRLDQLTASLRSDLDTYPKKARDGEATLNEAKSRVTRAKEAHTSAITQRKTAELDAEQWKIRARKFRDQSGSVKTNEAYKALQHEIANAEAEAAKAEDRVLDQMMAVEDSERRQKMFDAELKEAEAQFAAFRKQLETEYRAKKKQLDAATADHAVVSAKVPEDLLLLYTRVAKKNPGSALAEARDEMCRACGMRVLPHIIQVLKTETNEEVFRCEGCGRILHTLEPIPHAAPANNSAAAASE